MRSAESDNLIQKADSMSVRKQSVNIPVSIPLPVHVPVHVLVRVHEKEDDGL
jgi:hypothetical protein